MAQTIIQKILERIDERENPGDLDSRDVGDSPDEDLKWLVDRGILTAETFSTSAAITTEYLDDGTREQRVFQSSPETFYEIALPRILDAIQEDNALRGNLRGIEGRLFELGVKELPGLPSVRVYLSLRNQDADWLESVCDRVRRGPEDPSAVLVPRWVLVGQQIEQKNRESGLRLIDLSEHVTAGSWLLPWGEPVVDPSSDAPRLRILRATRQVFYRGLEVELTRTQFGLLLCLAENVGEFVAYDRLVRNVAGRDSELDIDAIDWAKNHKSKLMIPLRKLIGRAGITSPEIGALIRARHSSYELDLQRVDVEIV